MSIFEYNARLHEETLKKEGYEDGFEDGREDGRVEERGEILQNALQKSYTPEQIAEFTGVDLEEVLRVQRKMLQDES
ncbi:MAG: hypothetical protein IJD40_14625 [Lachnospiraceae bacterium]|nr:hypothetical protein [Lachnospiraceae bacterium]